MREREGERESEGERKRCGEGTFQDNDVMESLLSAHNPQEHCLIY